MSQLSATQIPKPADEQAFERASVVLWRALLNDHSVQRNGRRGQRQNGVDLFGILDGDVDWQVGVQCKLKSDGHVLREDEVQGEVAKALTFTPPLREFYITTTAPDDVRMQELARQITKDLAASGTAMRVFVWGWNTLEERIGEDLASRRAFDPTYGLFGEEMLAEIKAISVAQMGARDEMVVGFSRVETMISGMVAKLTMNPGDTTEVMNAVEAHLDAEIDGYRELNNNGKTLTALPLLQSLKARVGATASGRILFRIDANIGHCLLALGEDSEAVTMLHSAYEHAPEEPKAIANRAFGFLLKGDWRSLLEFGKSQLEIDPSNEWLGGYVVQGARFDTSVSDPLVLVPEQLRNTAAVQLGWVDFIRHRGEPGDWWGPARQLFEGHPSEPYAVQFAAAAEVDEITTSQRFRRTRLMSLTDRKRLEAATETLRSQWESARAADGPLRPEDAELCANVIVGLSALGDAVEAVTVSHQGLALAPDDVDILTRAAAVALDAGEEEFLRELLPKLPETDNTALLKFRYFASRGNWGEVAKLSETVDSVIPAREYAVVSTTVKLARLKVETENRQERQRGIALLADEAACDPRASVVAADFAYQEGMEHVAQRSFQAALSLIDEQSHAADRMMVAYHAERHDHSAVVADLLDGWVAEDYDNDELRTLARALANDSPIRERALSFFTRLAPEFRELPYYQHAEGIMHFNRGALREAEVAFRNAATLELNIEYLIGWILVLQRLDRLGDVREIIDDIDLEKVEGTPGQKMFLAQVVRISGQGTKALQYGYSVLRASRNDEKAALRYFGLIMMDAEDGLIPAAETVSIDTWVRLESDQKHGYAFLVEEGEDRSAEGVLSPTHPMAAAAFGRRIGDEFDIQSGLGGTRRWRVVEIKHKYLHALHDVMENFENRFPDAEGFYTVSMQDNDIQPVLDQIRRVAESNRKLVEFHLKKNVPLCFAVANGGRDTIRFAELIRSLGFDIRTCVGTDAERAAARDVINAHRDSGAVLDTYTAWTVSTMGAFDILESVFGDLLIPQTVIDEIKSIREDLPVKPDGAMSVAWHDGEYIRHEYKSEDIAARHDFLSEQLTQIQSVCDVRPIVAPNHPTELATTISQSFGSHVLDAANLSGENHVLLSEDMHYRQYGEASCGAKGVWLQAVFAFALDGGLIDLPRYGELMVKLAWRRHGHLALNAETLLTVFQASSQQGMEDFGTVADFIGTRNAEPRSHIQVSVDFLNSLWLGRGANDIRRMKATGMLLERNIRHSGDNWALVLALVRIGCIPAVQRYIDSWVFGHFLPSQAISDAVAEIKKAPADQGHSDHGGV